MATYAIGDIQGCFAEFKALLREIAFDEKKDVIWLTGDLVNRGPQSLEVLRYLHSLPASSYRIVLGNHDLHLLVCAYGLRITQRGDTLDEILNAPDRDELMNWLRQFPLLIHDEKLNCVMVHAGIAPMWNLEKAKALSLEVEKILKSDNPTIFLREMYGNDPNLWSDDLSGNERLRCIVNYFTRMRFCRLDGGMDLNVKGGANKRTMELVPWFELHREVQSQIVFGHWAALSGETGVRGVMALDTGCVWGGRLTGVRLEDGERYSVKAFS